MRRHVTQAMILLAALLAASAQSGQIVFRDSFEGSVSHWQPYHRDAPHATIASATGGAAEGARFLRVECPGHQKLEGVRATVPGVEPFALYTVRASVRGKGNLWGCLLSGNGWLYSKDSVALTGQWQDVRIPKLTGANDRTLSIYFITRETEKATFEIDAVTVTREPDPPHLDAAVGPVRLDAEAYAASEEAVKADRTALGGKALRASHYTGILNMPFPLTSRPAFVYLRVQPGTPQDEYVLWARIGGTLHRLAAATPTKPAGWQWVRLAVPRPAAARGSVDLRLGQPERGLAPALFDSVVLATDAGLRPAQLEAAPPLRRDRPLIAAGQCAKPPTIDGRADDPCWADCIAVRDFTLNGQDAAPSQQTTARLCYDAERLYIAFRCQEYVLQPEANQLHAFKQSKTARDDKVWADDSVVVILGPTSKGPCFDVFANARGTITDARCQRPNMWETRDKAWNGDVQAAGRVENGAWEVELAVAFKSLGVAAPEAGARWGLCLGRIERNAKETSAWNLVVAGFHETESLGTLVFLPKVGGADATLPDRIRGARNAVGVRRAPNAPPILADVAVGQAQAPPTRCRALVAPGAATKLPFDIRTEGHVALSCDLVDAASLTPLYLSPRLKRPVKASDARLRLLTSAPWAAFLNGVRVAGGARGDGSQVLTVPLETGVNAFSFQVESGRLAAVIELPGQRIVSDGAWRFAAGEPKGFTAATFNDSAWTKAGVLGEAGGEPGKQGAREIGGDGPGVLRRVVWFEKTYVWPTPEPAQHVPQNAAQHLTFSAPGMRGRRLHDFKLHLAVPPDFEVIGSTGYYGRPRADKAKFVTSGPEKARRHGEDVLVYQVRATAPLPYRPKVRVLELFNVFVRYRGPEKPAEEYTFEFWAEAEGGSVTECPQTFPVRVTLPLRGKQPKKLVMQLWGSFFGAMDDPAMKRAALATARLAGLNNVVSGSREDTELGAAYGVTNTMGINFDPWSLNRAAYIEQHPDDALLDAAGTRSTHFVCTTALLAHAWDDVARMLRERIEARRPHIVDWDYESSPFTSYLSCYCPRCLAAFRRHAGVADNVALSPATIKEKHAAQWIDFMTTRNAQVARKFREVVNASGASFSMYSGYESPSTHRTYGVDWHKIGRLKAADHVGCGYGRRKEQIDATVAALDGIPLVTGVLMRPYDRSLRERVVPLTKARVLRRLADATGGVLVYDRMPLGGRSWLALAEASRLAADHEQLFLQGKAAPELATVDGAAEPEVATRRHGKTGLLVLMNHGRKAKTFRVRLDPRAVQAARRYYANEDVAAGVAAAVPLPPGGAEAIVLTLR